MSVLIVIPARFGSTRFPGKPLVQIAGRAMLERVAVRARAAASKLPNASYLVATDDQRILDYCADKGLQAVMTSPDLASGSDRALAAADSLETPPNIVVNLQGDAPFTPIDHITAVVEALETSDADTATCCIPLGWSALDALRAAKATTPFSGTTCLIGPDGNALWFSKAIQPAIRDEDKRRKTDVLSPVYRHVGLYGFRYDALGRFAALPPSHYEVIEGLEQLRLIENAMTVRCAIVEAPKLSTSGIDTPEDLARVEDLIAANGDPDTDLFDDA